MPKHLRDHLAGLELVKKKSFEERAGYVFNADVESLCHREADSRYSFYLGIAAAF